MNEKHLAALLKSAMRATLKVLAEVEPDRVVRQLFRPGTGNVIFRAEEVTCPGYFGETAWAAAGGAGELEEARKLTGYLWDHGQPRKELSRDSGEPDRKGWEECVWFEMVVHPLQTLLASAAVDELVLGGTYKRGYVNDKTLDEAATDIALQTCQRRRRVRAVCPPVNFDVDGDEDIELEPGLAIRSKSVLSTCRFLSSFHREYLEADAATMHVRSLIEIEAEVPGLDEDEASTLIASRLDLVKWAALLACASRDVIEEGAVPIRGLDLWRGRTLRRFDTGMQNRVVHIIQASRSQADVMRSLVSSFRAAQKKTDDLDSVLWHFGRSCNASVARDAVLEAAVGLEMLLVDGKGDLTYRLKLHGMALINDEKEGEVWNDLDDLYKLRSRAAHGTARRDDKAFPAFAPRARLLLAKALARTARLVAAGEIDPSAHGGRMSPAIGDWVKRVVCRGTRHPNSPSITPT